MLLALEKDEIDLAVSMGLEHPGSIRAEVLFPDRMVCVMRRTHPLASLCRASGAAVQAGEEVKFAADSLLEGDGFEPSVPRQRSRNFLGFLCAGCHRPKTGLLRFARKNQYRAHQSSLSITVGPREAPFLQR